MKSLLSLLAFALTSLSVEAANPYLKATGEEPAVASFQGKEWGDEIESDHSPLSAQVTTQRVATMPWGALFKITFSDVKSKVKPRELRSWLFLATDERIVLINEANEAAAIKQLSSLPEPPKAADEDVYGLTKGRLKHSDPPAQSEVTVKGDLTIYRWTHSSGHFTRFVWKKDVGLLEYASGEGARADGFELKRSTEKKPKR